MIGQLRGAIIYKQPPALMLDVGGVGYELEASLATFAELPAVGAEVTLVTHLAVREDAHSLYGFASLAERDLFRSLIKVSGVGAKSALLILSGMSVAAFSRCVQEADTAALVKLPGIGKKTAERLVVELRDRIDQLGKNHGISRPSVDLKGAAATVGTGNEQDDATSALVALGYKPAEAARMVKAVKTDPDRPLSSEELIRLALQATVRR